MRAIGRWIVAAVALLFGRRRAERRRAREEGRIVPDAPPDRGAENALIVLLLAAAAFGVAFVVIYATDSIGNQTQFLGLALGAALACIAAALSVTARRLIVTEEIEDEYPEPEHPEEQERIDEIVRESGSRFTRKKLLGGAAGAAGGALGAALLAPALSLGPALETSSLRRTPWTRGRRLVDRHGKPISSAQIEQGNFYTAYAEGAPQDQMGNPVVVVRLDPGALHLPKERATWAPEGIVAYSKVCTHAGCAIALYRAPLFPPTQPRPALVCPCHYSTFDPSDGGKVIFGPAGRDLPQLPLLIDPQGNLRAGGNYSGPPGPSWSGVRSGRPI